MKIYIILILLTIMIFGSYLSCSDDNSTSSTPAENTFEAIGTWEAIYYNFNNIELTSSMRVVINKDYTFTISYTGTSETNYKSGKYTFNSDVTPKQITFTSLLKGTSVETATNCTANCTEAHIYSLHKSSLDITLTGASFETVTFPNEFTPTSGKLVYVLDKK